MIQATKRIDVTMSMLGTIMIVCWFVMLGPGGFFLLLAAFYGAIRENYTLLVISFFALLLPVVLTVAWGMILLVYKDRKPTEEEAMLNKGFLHDRQAPRYEEILSQYRNRV